MSLIKELERTKLIYLEKQINTYGRGHQDGYNNGINYSIDLIESTLAKIMGDLEAETIKVVTNDGSLLVDLLKVRKIIQRRIGGN